MGVSAIIPAAGRGERMGGGLHKQFLPLKGRPILRYVLEAFERCDSIDEVILVVPQERLEFCQTEIVGKFGFEKVRKVVPGGPRRQDSVYEGLKVAKGAEFVVIHDGVRPFVSPDLIARSVSCCRIYGAVVTAVRAKDTVKRGEDGFVSRTLTREELWLAQTPQAFAYGLLLEAYRRAEEEGLSATDDASLVERLGYRVKIMEGSYDNIKITTPEDLELAEGVLSWREKGASGFRV